VGEAIHNIGIIGGVWFFISMMLLIIFLGAMAISAGWRWAKYRIKDYKFERNYRKLCQEEKL